MHSTMQVLLKKNPAVSNELK